MPNHDTVLTTSIRPQSRPQAEITNVLEGGEPQIVPVEEPVEEPVNEEVVNDGSFGMLGQRFEQRQRELEASETDQQEIDPPSALGEFGATITMQPEEEDDDESWFSSLFNNVASFFGKDSEE